jgi:hypothetical protein
MGVVYEALDRQRGTIVALKTITAADAAGIYRLKKEFRALAGLSHPNLVALHELHRADDRWFLVMELVHGVDFVRWVRGESTQAARTVTSELDWSAPAVPKPAPRGSFDEAKLRLALEQMVAALRALHDAGRLHCDLKPSNVLVAPDGRLTILDFGIARIHAAGASQMSLESTVVGTPAYMAPEQASGESLSPATDWYALGVMLYEALTGVVPFGGSIAELVTSKQFAHAPDPRALVDGLPDDLASLCVSLLQAEPDERLTGEEVARRVLGSPVRIATPRAARLLVGRESELAVLREAFEHAQHGAELVLIEGGPGVGKSALLRGLAASLPSEALVLSGACHDRESMPYKAFDAIVDGLARHLRRFDRPLPAEMPALARLFPVLARLPAVSEMAPVRAALDPRALRQLAFGALRRVLASLAGAHPVVLLVDDLAWGDADSAALLEELLAPPNAPRLLVVGTCRTADVVTSELLRWTMAPAWSERMGAEPLRLALGPLRVQAAQALAGEALGNHDAALIRSIAQEADGNPELIVELCDHVRTHGERGIPRIEEMLVTRVRALSGEARDLLEVLAIAGGPLPGSLAVRASSVSRDRSMRALAELESGHLCRSQTSRQHEDDIDVYHSAVREAVLHDVGEQRLRLRHASLAQALAMRGEEERAAHHFEAAGERARASALLEQAARSAEHALAFDRAALSLRRALELADPRRPDRGAWLERLGDALASAGRSREAGEAYLAAAEGGARRNRAELERLAAEHLLRSGHIDEGMAAMQRVLSELGIRMPSSPRATLASLVYHRARLRLRGLEPRRGSAMDERDRQAMDACWSMAVGMSMVDSIVGADFHARHLLRALRAGDPARLARAFALEAGHLASTDSRKQQDAERLLERAEQIGRELGDAHALGLVHTMRAADSIFRSSWRNAVVRADEAVALFRDRCVNVAWEIASAQRFAFVGLYYLGEIAELGRRMPDAIADARARGDRFAESCVRSGSSVVVWLARDDAGTARKHLEDEARRWGKERFALQHYLALQGLTYVDLYEGRPADALRRMGRVAHRLERSQLLRVELLRVTLWSLRARAALAVGDLGAAERDAARLMRQVMPSAHAAAALLYAAIARERGDYPAAVAGYRACLVDLDRLEMKLLAAAVRYRLARLTNEDRSASDAYFARHGVRRPKALVAAVTP